MNVISRVARSVWQNQPNGKSKPAQRPIKPAQYQNSKYAPAKPYALLFKVQQRCYCGDTRRLYYFMSEYLLYVTDNATLG